MERPLRLGLLRVSRGNHLCDRRQWLALCVNIGWQAAATAADGTTFDGVWSVNLACSKYGEADGYDWQFSAEVRGGHLAGKYVNRSDPPNYGVLAGTINAGGDAVLTMDGSTGAPAYNVHHEVLHTRIHYTASAHLDGSSGTGKRFEQRPCDMIFTKS
jgi:hypothetical protein